MGEGARLKVGHPIGMLGTQLAKFAAGYRFFPTIAPTNDVWPDIDYQKICGILALINGGPLIFPNLLGILDLDANGFHESPRLKYTLNMNQAALNCKYYFEIILWISHKGT